MYPKLYCFLICKNMFFKEDRDDFSSNSCNSLLVNKFPHINHIIIAVFTVRLRIVEKEPCIQLTDNKRTDEKKFLSVIIRNITLRKIKLSMKYILYISAYISWVKNKKWVLFMSFTALAYWSFLDLLTVNIFVWG